MQAWQVQSNVETFGHYEAACILRKRGATFEQAYKLIFGRAPKRS